MSYSFSLSATTKTEAKEKIAGEFEKIVAGQAVHKKDQQIAVAACEDFINLMDYDDSKDIVMSVSGTLSGNWAQSDVTSLTGASFSVIVALAPKLAAV